MEKKNLFIIIYCIIIALSVMYATQPLQPLLAEKFNISISKASQFTAIIMLFLAIAPIFYGYVLEKFCAKKMLLYSSCILLITNLFLGLANTYEIFLLFRFFEALVIPAILTSLMTILANIDKENIKFNMSIYVASTILGGLIGRIISGAITTSFSYEYVFYSLSFTLLVSLFVINKLDYEGDATLAKPQMKDILDILKDRRFSLVYFLMFSMFFVFAGVLNVLPFRLKELSSSINEFQISLLYIGYAMGLFASLKAKKMITLFKGEINTILVGIFVYLVSTFFLLYENIIFLFLMIFLFCFGMFTVHTVSTGLANTMKESKKSLTSGMYLSFYYFGAAVGSFLPSIIYDKLGWNIMIYMLIFILGFTMLSVYKSRKFFKVL